MKTKNDLISRKAAIKHIEKYYPRTSTVKSILSYLCTAPEAERPKGQWSDLSQFGTSTGWIAFTVRIV